MSKVFKIILGLSLLATAQTETAAGRFARGAWKFVKSPSMALGTLGSGAYYQYSMDQKNKMMESIQAESEAETVLENACEEFYSLKQQMSPQAQLTLQIPDTVEHQYKVKIAKKNIQDILQKNHGIQADFIIYDQNDPYLFAMLKHQDKIVLKMGRNTGLLGKEDTEQLTPEETAWVLGHEYGHVKNNDGRNKDRLKATLPATLATIWRSYRLFGKGKIASLAAAACGYIVHTYTYAQYEQYYELRADREANPAHPELGFGCFEKVLIPLQEQLDEDLYQMAKKADISLPLVKSLQAFDRNFDSHPSNEIRLDALKEQERNK